MEVSEHVAVLEEVGERLGLAAAAAGLDEPVPHCEPWLVRDLLSHIGGVHRWARSYVADGKTKESSAEEEAAFFAVVDDPELLEWYQTGHRRLVEALRSADPETSCWSFLPAPSPLSFWARRQAHETAIHCADAEAAAGVASVFPPASPSTASTSC